MPISSDAAVKTIQKAGWFKKSIRLEREDTFALAEDYRPQEYQQYGWQEDGSGSDQESEAPYIQFLASTADEPLVNYSYFKFTGQQLFLSALQKRCQKFSFTL